MSRTAELAGHLEKKLEGGSEHLHSSVLARTAENQANSKAAEAEHGHEPPAPDQVVEVINSASKTQLLKVPGIGDATARRIIESRLFESEAEVVESKVMPDSVLKKLKDKLADADKGVA